MVVEFVGGRRAWGRWKYWGYSGYSGGGLDDGVAGKSGGIPGMLEESQENRGSRKNASADARKFKRVAR